MKTYYLNALIFLLLSHLAIGQNYSEGITKEYSFSNQVSPAITIHFNNVKLQNVKKAMEQEFKAYKSKISEVDGAKMEFNVVNFTLSNNKLSKGKIKIDQFSENISLFASFKTTESIISDEQTPLEINLYKNLVKTIAKKAVYLEYKDIQKLQDRELNSQESVLKKLNKEIKNVQTSISKNKIAIRNSENEVEQLNRSLESTNETILKNKKAIQTKEAEIASKNTKSLQSEIENLEKENLSSSKLIDEHNIKIAQIEGKNAILNSSYEGKNTEVKTLKLSDNIDKKVLKKIKSIEKEKLKIIGEIEENKILIKNEDNKINAIREEINGRKNKITLTQLELSEHNESALLEQLKLLQREEKKLKKKKKAELKGIKKENENNLQMKESIKNSEQNINSIKSAIEKQKSKIDDLKAKLSNTLQAKKEFE